MRSSRSRISWIWTSRPGQVLGAVLVRDERGRLRRHHAHGLVALAPEVVEVRPGASLGHLQLAERVPQHVALAAALLEAGLAPLQLVAQVAHAVFGHRGLAGNALARGKRLREQALRLRHLRAQLLAARVHLRPALLGGGDAAEQVAMVLLQAPALRLRGRRPLAQRGQHALGLGAADLGRLAGRARFRHRRGQRGQAPAAFVAVALGRAQGLLDLGQAHRGRPALLLRLPALGVEHGLLPLQARHLLLRGEEVVAQGDEVLLRDVDALLEAAHLRHRRLRAGGRLLPALARGAQGDLDLLLADRDLADLAAGREEALHAAPAFHHRAAQRSRRRGSRRPRGPGARRSRTRPPACHDQRFRKRGLDGRGVGAGHAVDVAEQAARLRLLRGDVAQGHAVGLRARGGQGQEGAASGAGLLQVADPRSASAASGASTACRRSPRNASTARSYGESVSTASATTPAPRCLPGPQQRAHALVEGGVRGHHLLQRSQAAGQAVALALEALRLARRRRPLPCARPAARGGALARRLQLARRRLGLRLLHARDARTRSTRPRSAPAPPSPRPASGGRRKRARRSR